MEVKSFRGNICHNSFPYVLEINDSDRMINLENHPTDFDEILYEHHAIGDYSNHQL